MVNGHTHANVITPHSRSELIAGTTGGFWEVNTASHIDWPVQSRIVEIAASAGVVSIFATLVDIDAPIVGGTANPNLLAATARELAANDPTERPKNRRGDAADRNVQLLVAAPFTLPAPEESGSSVALGSNTDGRLVACGTNTADEIFRRIQP